MASRTGRLFVTSLITGCLVAAAPAQPDPYQAITAFVGVTVLPMDKETVVPNQTVIVREQKIAWMGSADAATIPANAARVDGKGKFLMPGLAEMHAHIPGGKAPDSAIHRTLFLYVANGVTTIRGMLGEPRHLSYRSSVANGAVLGPRIFTTGPSFNGNTAPTREAAVEAVIAQKKAGFDLLKIHPGVPRDAFDALAAKAHELKIPFAGHVPADVGLQRALDARYRSIDHLDGYVEALAKPGTPSQFFGVNLMTQVDESGIPALVKATRAAGVWQVPTEVLLDNLLNDETADALAARPEMKYVIQQSDIQSWMKQREQFQKIPQAERKRLLTIRRRLIKDMHDAGVPFALGSDAPQMWNVPGFSIHRELQSMIDAGLTPYQALKTGTTNVGLYFGTTDGVVAAGRRADLVLLDANPLQAIANSSKIAGVMVNGRWLSKADIDARLAASH
ncbi:MAG TPA: amidohydrolase family protein [Vicinamibacterales bacterium]|jgi:imidazolonepropionase-like amidohydrolase